MMYQPNIKTKLPNMIGIILNVVIHQSKIKAKLLNNVNTTEHKDTSTEQKDKTTKHNVNTTEHKVNNTEYNDVSTQHKDKIYQT